MQINHFSHLNSLDFHTPRISCLIQRCLHCVGDGLPLRKDLSQVACAQNIPQCCGSQETCRVTADVNGPESKHAAIPTEKANYAIANPVHSQDIKAMVSQNNMPSYFCHLDTIHYATCLQPTMLISTVLLSKQTPTEKKL